MSRSSSSSGPCGSASSAVNVVRTPSACRNCSSSVVRASSKRPRSSGSAPAARSPAGSRPSSTGWSRSHHAVYGGRSAYEPSGSRVRTGLTTASRYGGRARAASACGHASSSTRSRSRTTSSSAATGGTPTGSASSACSASRASSAHSARPSGASSSSPVGWPCGRAVGGGGRVEPLQVVRVEHHVLGADQHEVGQHPDGGQDFGAPAVQQLVVDPAACPPPGPVRRTGCPAGSAHPRG